MRKIFLALLLAVSVLSCTDGSRFVVKGTVSGADSTMLYLERNGLDGLSVLDSVRLDAKGGFSLKGEKPQLPEFYRLRFGSKIIPFSVIPEGESSFSIRVDSFPAYTVEGSDVNGQIQRIVALVSATNAKIAAEVDAFARKEYDSRDTLEAKIFESVKVYKDTVRRIVLADTKSPVAYFAIFQKLNYGITPFSVLDKSDLKVYSAVATAWDSHYKESVRTKQMLNMIQQARMDMTQAALERFSNENRSGFVDLNLPNRKGDRVRLSSMKGNYILLDFCSYSQMTPDDILILKDLYAKNRAKGLKIYQVSFDQDLDYWKKMVADFSWTCVSDLLGTSASTYNVTSLPANYLIDKDGNVVAKNVRWDMVGSLLK